ncbi:long-chain-fatty-acid--CoA ligase [Pseudonocardia tropica]|uniref:Long-chain-fatty-acid--CoA ligase n=1 Tax=Pseudonocardia tropica TaxID=681289 RepID=A0ABV1JYL4_9PSEU
METWITELTPLSFLHRSATVLPDKPAVVHGTSSWTFHELFDAVERRARALRAAGVRPGDRVAYLMPNVPEMLAAHFAVPLVEAVLVAVNTRLATDEVRWILEHCSATVLVVDAEYAPTVAPLAGLLPHLRTVVVATDPHGPEPTVDVPDSVWLDDFLAGADGDTAPLQWAIADERATIAINYTSGTTGRPKGVMYTHRGAYLNSLGQIQTSAHDADSVYLWTLPMFHCNGWCTAWALVAAGGTQVCLREVRGGPIWQLIDRHGVTHLNGAPTVVTTIMNAEQAHQLDRSLVVTTAGAPPSPTTILQMETMGFTIVHVYGLTETYGPYSVCQWKDEWQDLTPEERARMQSRQGVAMVVADRVRIVETNRSDDELVDVPADGTTMGEIVMRGNTVMKGYYDDPDSTAAAFTGGWFHSGDLGVQHPDGYVELRDRAKDVIVSGGENISTVEVEQAVLSHPAVLEAAVIGVPDEKWGERPKAFVVLRPEQQAGADDILAHVRGRIARYKSPREVELLAELPKTSTGKIQKFELREKEWASEGSRIRG